MDNECFRNASHVQKSYDIRMVSGWLYIAKPSLRAVQSTQHWWDDDPNQNVFYDHSPNIEPNAIHVLDPGLTRFI